MLFSKKKNKIKSAPTPQGNVIENEEFYQKGVATVRGLIAPSALQIQANHLQIGDVLSTTMFVVAYPRFLNDNWFSPIINIDAWHWNGI